MPLNFDQNYFLGKYKYFIFDFDGIIKDSVNAKKKAYCKLFENYEFAKSLIEEHHLMNGGVSRYEKIPIYLKFCNLGSSSELIDHYLKRFSEIVIKLVLESDWVPGIIQFLEKIKEKNNIFIVSATPECEIKKLCTKLEINIPHQNIFGSPNSKEVNICRFFKKEFLREYIFFGDSISDSQAALAFDIDFAFRSYNLNALKTPAYSNYVFSDFENVIN